MGLFPTAEERAAKAAANPKDFQQATQLLREWHKSARVLGALGNAAEKMYAYEYLNAAPPEEPFFAELLDALRKLPRTDDVLGGICVVTRILGRRYDAECEEAHLARIALRPGGGGYHYNLGLFYKTRGRWADGVAANRTAAQLGDNGEATWWNLGICATAGGDEAAAKQAWDTLRIPKGGLGSVQVRLAQYPLAERTHDDPGLEETIWVERLGACHGRVRSALFQTLGVDYGDIVVFDGAPIVTRDFGGDIGQVPVFPHLMTLARGDWRVFPFAGTQQEANQLAELAIAPDFELYVHDEQVRILCADCWDNPDQTHRHQGEAEAKTVTGKLCFLSSLPLTEVRDRIDALQGVRVFVPDLHSALGDEARAEVERRRAAMITGTPPK